MNCDYCRTSIDNPKPGQRFCSDHAKHCRQRWHHEHQLPGVVKLMRQIKGGKWSVTIHYPDQPAVHIDQRVAMLKTEPNSRPEASRQPDEEAET